MKCCHKNKKEILSFISVSFNNDHGIAVLMMMVMMVFNFINNVHQFLFIFAIFPSINSSHYKIIIYLEINFFVFHTMHRLTAQRDILLKSICNIRKPKPTGCLLFV